MATLYTCIHNMMERGTSHWYSGISHWVPGGFPSTISQRRGQDSTTYMHLTGGSSSSPQVIPMATNDLNHSDHQMVGTGMNWRNRLSSLSLVTFWCNLRHRLCRAWSLIASCSACCNITWLWLTGRCPRKHGKTPPAGRQQPLLWAGRLSLCGLS